MEYGEFVSIHLYILSYALADILDRSGLQNEGLQVTVLYNRRVLKPAQGWSSLHVCVRGRGRGGGGGGGGGSS